MVASPEYFDYYYPLRSKLLLPINLNDDRKNTAYIKTTKELKPRTNDSVAGMTAVYYGLVEEVDHWVGLILDKLDRLRLTNKTLVVFTSDHGEMLGAHGRVGKGNLFEEAIRVPMVMSFPGEIPAGRVVNQPVTHIDVFATGK